jgi:alpha-1,2-mannosyltransferase
MGLEEVHRPVGLAAVQRAAGHAPLALTLGLLAFFVANALLLNALVWSASPAPYRNTVLKDTWELVHGEGGDDSWGAMQAALDHLAETPDAPLYAKVFFADNVRFQYPPSALFALSAMLALAPERVQIDDAYEGPWPALNSLLGWLFIALTAISVAAVLENTLAGKKPDIDWRRMRAVRALLVVGFTLTFYPVVKAFTLGQIQVWMNALFALGLFAWVTRWKFLSGVLIGLVGLIKPHYGLLLVWAAMRREMRFAAACAITIASGMAASVAVYGLANHLDYLSVLSFLSQRGEAYYPNQSINGILNRLMSISSPEAFVTLDLPTGQFPPFTPWIWAGTLLSSLVLLGFALLRFHRRAAEGSVMDLALMAIACTMASPIAWEHHYGMTLPIYAVMLASTLGDRKRLTWLALSYALVSTFVPATNLLAGSPFNLLQSTLFAGAIVLFVLLATIGARPTGGAFKSATPLPLEMPIERASGAETLRAERCKSNG